MGLTYDEAEERRRIIRLVQSRNLPEECVVCPFNLVCLTDNIDLLVKLFTRIGAVCTMCGRVWAQDVKETHRSYRCKRDMSDLSLIDHQDGYACFKEWVCYDCTAETKAYAAYLERKWPKGEPG